MIKKCYTDLLNISEDGGRIKLKTKSNTVVCNGYDRIVFGGRGPYIEFNKNQLLDNAFFVPKSQLYRISDSRIYYIEFRSNDVSNVKLYYQMRTVAYADYKLGYFYMSPLDLYTDDNIVCMNSINIGIVNSELFFKF